MTHLDAGRNRKIARVIGTVTDSHPATVIVRTRLGTSRIVGLLSGDQLPRIC